MTAALGVYQKLQVPLPWQPARDRFPLIVYGGATAVGSFAIKFASLSNIHPIITVAGNGIPHVESLIDRAKGDSIVDYRKGNAHVVEELRKHAGTDILLAFDAVSEKGSVTNIGKILPKGGKITTVLPIQVTGEDPGQAEVVPTSVGAVHKERPTATKATEDAPVLGDREFGAIFYHFIGLGLAEGWLKGHPYEVVEGGLGGLRNALKQLEEGKVSAKKLVIRIGDTEGLRK